MKRALLIALPLLLAPAQAPAQEIFGGGFVHDVETPLTRAGQENGLDLNLGWRGRRIEALRFVGAPSPHAYVLVNTAGDTSFASFGIGWRIGGRVYARPGVGIAIHNGPTLEEATPDRIAFGSRIIFAPELSAGVQVSERVSVEASWIHFSHAQLFGRHNPGSDNFGLRLNYRY